MNKNFKTLCVLGAFLVLGVHAVAQTQPMQMSSQPFNPQQTASLQSGFVAPQMQMIGQQPAHVTAGNSCTTSRYDNSRIQGGQLVPPPTTNGSHFFGG